MSGPERSVGAAIRGAMVAKAALAMMESRGDVHVMRLMLADIDGSVDALRKYIDSVTPKLGGAA